MADTPESIETQEHSPYQHEQNVVSIRTIVKFGVGLLALTVMSFALTGWMFDYFAARQAELDVPSSPLVETRQPPPGPRLQVTPAQALQETRATQQAVLNSYGWIDREAGLVRIPIDRAIELLAERGLPARREETQAE